MKAGTVFFWKDVRRDPSGRSKGRWFVYLGKTGYGSNPLLYHVATTTTRKEHYLPGAVRANHLRMDLRPEDGGFIERCILDVDQDIYSETAASIEENPNVEVKGTLTSPRLGDLFSLISSSRYISKPVKTDIFFCLREAGIPGIARP